MRMLPACINKQFLEHLPPQAILREHALYGIFNDGFRLLSQQVARSRLALSARITRVAHIFFLVHLQARKTNLIGIDHNDVIATVNMGCIRRLVLATQNMCNAGTQTPDYLTLSVYDVPFALNFFTLCRTRLVTQGIHYRIVFSLKRRANGFYPLNSLSAPENTRLRQASPNAAQRYGFYPLQTKLFEEKICTTSHNCLIIRQKIAQKLSTHRKRDCSGGLQQLLSAGQKGSHLPKGRRSGCALS